MSLLEDNQIISQDKQIAKKFNKYFRRIAIVNMPKKSEV